MLREIVHHIGTVLFIVLWVTGGVLLWTEVTWFGVLCFAIAAALGAYESWKLVQRFRSK